MFWMMGVYTDTFLRRINCAVVSTVLEGVDSVYPCAPFFGAVNVALGLVFGSFVIVSLFWVWCGFLRVVWVLFRVGWMRV